MLSTGLILREACSYKISYKDRQYKIINQKKTEQTLYKLSEKMKTLIFDSGPIISLATNNLLWLIEPLRQSFNGDFLLSESVRAELVDRPIEMKKFKFEALQVLALLKAGTLKIMPTSSEIEQKKQQIMDLANKCFQAKGNWIRIVHEAEIESLAAALMLGAEAVVIDERTTRVLIEQPERLKDLLKRRLGMKVKIDKNNLRQIRKLIKGIRIIRSTELVTIAYEMGLLDKFLPEMPNPRKQLIESVLWGVKLHGCSISQREIDQVVKHEIKRKG